MQQVSLVTEVGGLDTLASCRLAEVPHDYLSEECEVDDNLSSERSLYRVNLRDMKLRKRGHALVMCEKLRLL